MSGFLVEAFYCSALRLYFVVWVFSFVWESSVGHAGEYDLLSALVCRASAKLIGPDCSNNSLQVHVFEFRMARGAALFLACCLLAAGYTEAGRLGAKRSVLQATTINNNNNNNNGTCNDFHAGSNVFFAMFHVW